jgi:murein DD-endopeptidase MepM/ murein hydrolase activator NlpD
MRERTRGFSLFLIATLIASGPVSASAVLPRVAHHKSTRPHVSRLAPASRVTSHSSSPLRARAGTAPAPQDTSEPTTSSSLSTLDQIQKQLRVHRRILEQTQQQETRVLRQLSWAQENLQRAQVELRQTSVAVTGTRQEVARATQDLADVSGRLAEHKALMGARLRMFYEKGALGYLDVLLGSTGFQDFATRSYLIALVINRDVRLFQRVYSEHQKRNEVHATLVVHEQQLAAQQQHWAASREETTRLAEERRRLLERVRTERSAQETAIRELELESGRITDLIRHATVGRRGGPHLTLANGMLLWPVSGPITSGYGWRIHPIFGTREFHTGVDIAAPYGTPIRAPLDGTVLFTGWMGGYGRLVILDHGNGLSTTYGHLSAFKVHVGDHVQRGETIAAIGSTGWSTGPHLFFEVREDGKPINPLGGT